MSRNGLFRVTHFVARRGFRLFERLLGLHVVPAHYYSPIPISSELGEDVYTREFGEIGLDWNEQKQLELLGEVFPAYVDEFEAESNPGLSLGDAFALHVMIRETRPAQMVEIGSGFSTLIALRALRLNRDEGHPFRLTAIEPYPRAELLAIDDPDFELLGRRVQDVPLERFADVDLLFVDSAHVSKIDSDVNYEILEIVPRLKPGAYVHWHDIVMPTNYWKDWIESGNQFWNESYMLHAFLLFNDEFSVVWASRFMQLRHGEALASRLPWVRPDHRLTSFWIQRRPE